MAVRILRKPFLCAAVICALIFYSGFLSFSQKIPLFFLFAREDIRAVSGTILSSPVKTRSGRFYSCDFRLNSVRSADGALGGASGEILLYIPSEIVEALYPGGLHSGGRGEGRESALFETGLHAVFSGRFSDSSFFASDCAASWWDVSLTGRIRRFRALCRLAFKRMMFAWGNAGGLILALLCGARDFTEPSTSDAFRTAGLSHILALSGMHLSLFSSLAVFAGRKAGSIHLSYILRIVIVSVFVWFAGFSPSLLRAFICVLISIFASIAGIPDLPMFDVLCAAFLVQCAVCPSHIHNAGFMLSYGALAGISLFAPLVNGFLSRLFPRSASSSLSSSVSAQAFTAPITLRVFGTFSPVGIIAAVFVSPLVTFFVYSAFALIIISLIFPIFQVPSGIFMNFLYTVIKTMVLWFSRAPVIGAR